MRNYAGTVREEIVSIAIFIIIIGLVFLLDIFLPLEKVGLIPRDWKGLIGIITMPFLHGDVAHITGNMVPLIVMLALLAGSRANSFLIICLISLIGGSLLWLFGRGDTIHIGASLLVFGLAVFLIVSGLLEKRIVPLIIAVFVAISYGGVLVSGLAPWQLGVSWDGHLFGGLSGGIVAWMLLGRNVYKILP